VEPEPVWWVGAGAEQYVDWLCNTEGKEEGISEMEVTKEQGDNKRRGKREACRQSLPSCGRGLGSPAACGPPPCRRPG